MNAFYRVIRSRRRSVAVIVADGSVTVRAPLGMSDDAIARFVESKRAWIERKLVRDPRFDAVRRGEAVLRAGESFPMRFGERTGEEGGVFYFKNAAAVRPYFIKRWGTQLTDRLLFLSRQARLYPSAVCLRDFKARWGSCDGAGVIKLNWRLLMLPPALCDYVLLHELCHLAVPDHSAAFWALLSRFCPFPKRLRAELKRYAFLTLLYRNAS